MMAQWHMCKKKAKGALLLFRLGDFYEAFYDDAILLSKTADLVLTKRQGIPMSGVPAHAAEGYIEKLVKKGFLVAIAEQIEDPGQVKGLVKRDVVKIVSPGTLHLHNRENNFLACIAQLNRIYALSLLDISTGELRVIELSDEKELQDELFRRAPSEILLPEKKNYSFLEEIKKQLPFRITTREVWHFDYHSCYTTLIRHFKIHTLDGFGLQGMEAAVQASGVLLAYVQDELNLPTSHIKRLFRDELSSYMSIDRTTQRNLELTESLHTHTNNSTTLLKLLDSTYTPMGTRLFKTWMTHPLLSVKEIKKRQDAVEELQQHLPISHLLKHIRDLERLIIRIATSSSATPRDLTALRYSLEKIPEIMEALSPLSSPLIRALRTALPDPSPIIKKIAETIVDTPPLSWGEGKIIRSNVDTRLDELCSLKTNSHSWIANYQSQLKEITGIKNLKIAFSKGFGYCIEVSRGQAANMPSTFQRRQTLVNSERFISPELKTYETKIFSAEEEIQEIEKQLYNRLREEIGSHTESVKILSHSIATLDVLLSLARTASERHYCRPLVNDGRAIDIQLGRHPIIEASLTDSAFVPNDTTFDSSYFLLLTGPNMSGKSTYIRQVALITVMAQMGSFVPAHSATIGIVDKLFSRIGANDDLSHGKSTFMVEMTETANILNNATPRSLIILDEIGRGTSTYDGIAISWSVSEDLIRKGCKILFATHYSELTNLEGVKNVSVAVKESSDTIIFLRKIVEGSSDKSYGIHVARLAGFPHPVLARAYKILHQLESKAPDPKSPLSPGENRQEALTPLPTHSKEQSAEIEELLKELKNIELDQITPLQALQQIKTWQEHLTTHLI